MEPNTCRMCGVGIPSFMAKRPKERQLYCSNKCGAAYRNTLRPRVTHHKCRVCGVDFPIRPDQGQKWLCSRECRKARVARNAREFHKRQPLAQAKYRQRSKEKKLPDGNILRFYRWNPHAPRQCEACGEARVLTMAHKPHCPRLGEHRKRDNCQWPSMVWVLCPTCHALLDRMNYTPEELGLK